MFRHQRDARQFALTSVGVLQCVCVSVSENLLSLVSVTCGHITGLLSVSAG